jgi:hypothetical protein
VGNQDASRVTFQCGLWQPYSTPASAVRSDLQLTPRRCAVIRLSHVVDGNSDALHVASRMLSTGDS